MSPRILITEASVLEAIRSGQTQLNIPAGALVTPLARDTARDKGLALVDVPASDISARASAVPGLNLLAGGGGAAALVIPRIVAIGCDHRGRVLKQQLVAALQREGVACADVGCHSDEPAHYPIQAYAVAVLVASGRADMGVMIDGAGIGSAIAANKVRGARAANCLSIAAARSAREHNDANILTFAGDLPPAEAHAVLETFVRTPFAAGRHTVRLDLIRQIEDLTMR